MALPKDRGLPDLEKDKFDLNDAGEVIVRTSASGVIQPIGLQTAGRNYTMNVSTSAVALPSLGPLTDRNALAIHNLDDTNTLYVGFDNTVTADSTPGSQTSGWPVYPGATLQFDLTDDVVIYGIASTTIKIIIMELA